MLCYVNLADFFRVFFLIFFLKKSCWCFGNVINSLFSERLQHRAIVNLDCGSEFFFFKNQSQIALMSLNLVEWMGWHWKVWAESLLCDQSITIKQTKLKSNWQKIETILLCFPLQWESSIHFYHETNLNEIEWNRKKNLFEKVLKIYNFIITMASFSSRP